MAARTFSFASSACWRVTFDAPLTVRPALHFFFPDPPALSLPSRGEIKVDRPHTEIKRKAMQTGLYLHLGPRVGRDRLESKPAPSRDPRRHRGDRRRRRRRRYRLGRQRSRCRRSTAHQTPTRWRAIGGDSIAVVVIVLVGKERGGESRHHVELSSRFVAS